MKVIHRLVGYNAKTDAMEYRRDIPPAALGPVKRIAEVPPSDPEITDAYSLTAEQAQNVAAAIGVELDRRPLDYFIESFAQSAAKDQHTRASA